MVCPGFFHWTETQVSWVFFSWNKTSDGRAGVNVRRAEIWKLSTIRNTAQSNVALKKASTLKIAQFELACPSTRDSQSCDTSAYGVSVWLSLAQLTSAVGASCLQASGSLCSLGGPTAIPYQVVRIHPQWCGLQSWPSDHLLSLCPSILQGQPRNNEKQTSFQ